jgi:hypothetical protein
VRLGQISPPPHFDTYPSGLFVVAQPDAFLSYTRLDDEFFGGAITSLKKFLELGVKVVTGQRDFSIFQDVKFARRQRVARMTGSTKRWSPGSAE